MAAVGEAGATAAVNSVGVQEGLHSSLIDYYDIMLIGMTGQGKSTTADKLLIANPDGVNYIGDVEATFSAADRQANYRYSDLTMWVLSNAEHQMERTKTRLKNLYFYRSLESPHIEVNESRENNMNMYLSTSECELFSNETTRVRILDVPGFFSLPNSPKQATGNRESLDPLAEDTENTKQNHLGIMRNILRIQAAMRMKFRRILYFLPFRGPIEKGNMVLQQELQLMAYYFGKSIFENMVLVATMSGHISKLDIPDVSLFPPELREQTQKLFQGVLHNVLTLETEEELPKPPVIFVSLAQSCEAILHEVKCAEVSKRGLMLQFEPTICTRCSMKIGQLRGENVVCAFGRDWSQSMPYENSTCHPILVPKYTRLQRIKEEIVYFVHLKWNQGESWPDFSTEICPACEKDAGQQGCMKMGHDYQLKKGRGAIKVSHSHEIVEGHRGLMQADYGEVSEDEEAPPDRNPPN